MSVKFLIGSLVAATVIFTGCASKDVSSAGAGANSGANGASSSIQYASYDSGAWTNLTSIPNHAGYGGWLVPFQNQGFLMVCFGQYIYTKAYIFRTLPSSRFGS